MSNDESKVQSVPEPKLPKQAATKNSPVLVAGLVAAIVAAAFLGGYSLGAQNESVSNAELAQLIRDMQEPTVQIQQAQRPSNEPIFVSLDDDPVLGNPDAPLTIVEFSDFQCPFCGRFYEETLPLLVENYVSTGKVKLVYRDLPLAIHENAIPAHVAAECAHAQGLFWEYHDILFEQMAEWKDLSNADLEAKLKEYAQTLGLDSSFDSCIHSASILQEVRHDRAQATEYGVRGTPTFFVGNEDIGYIKLAGAKSYSTFELVLDSRLE